MTLFAAITEVSSLAWFVPNHGPWKKNTIWKTIYLHILCFRSARKALSLPCNAVCKSVNSIDEVYKERPYELLIKG